MAARWLARYDLLLLELKITQLVILKSYGGQENIAAVID